MGRIQKKFTDLKRNKKKALILFMTAGDPGLKKNEDLIYAFEKEGVDLIELGVPFSDPLADGPVIQASSKRALERKTTLGGILSLVKRARRRSQTPLLLMTYLNPILGYGLKKFAKDASLAGVDGVIVPDLPPEEGKEIAKEFASKKLDLVYLLAPTSPAARQKLVARSSKGFVYYVSMTGVTGGNSKLPADIKRHVSAFKRKTRLPVCIGFGVSTPEQAKLMASTADGVIIGSAIVRALSENTSLSAGRFAEKFVRPFARALGKGR